MRQDQPTPTLHNVYSPSFFTRVSELHYASTKSFIDHHFSSATNH
jgi:hypothetical protein